MITEVESPGVTLGKIIRHRRRQLGLTLDELATRCWVSKPYLSLIENAKCHPPTDEKLARVAVAVGVDPDELLALKALALAPPSLAVRARLRVLLERQEVANA